jgi:hypothetical protein
MLGTLIEKLSALLSKGAFIASFIPLLAFVAANTALLAAVHQPTRAWFISHRADPELIGGGVLAFLIGALMFAAINTRLRELMEGRFWPAPICGAFTERQRDRFQQLAKQNTSMQRAMRKMGGAPQWKETLKNARSADPKKTGRVYSPAGRAGRLIRGLRRRKFRGEVIDPEDLKIAVNRLKRELRITPMSLPLDADHVELVSIIDANSPKIGSEIKRIFNERQFNFPFDERDPLAATAMGNIALSIQSYARSRYRLNIETSWTRFQKVMQGEAFYAVLQDAKVQLDFLVSLYWLGLVSTAGWLIALASFGYSLWPFLAIAICGPCAVWAAYRLALQNYRAFADLMRSSIDMYRMRLLKELNVSEPMGSEEEKMLWQALQGRMDYGKDFYMGYRRSE